jgi:hypothetical protein
MALLAVLPPLLGHAGHRAYFTLRPVDSTVVLEVRLHDHDLDASLRAAEWCDSTVDRTICAANLIRHGCRITINGQGADMTLLSAVRSSSDEVLRFRLNIDPRTIRTVTVENTCFLSSHPSFENIVRLMFRDDVSYSMTKRRTRITHTY